MTLNRRSFLVSALSTLAVAPALPVRADDRISLSEISRFFNSFSTAQAEFTQINPDGGITTGRVFIHRPGRVRFEYDPPERSLVMASGGQVAIFDARSNQGPNQYPLRRTPLNLILEREVDLSRRRMVVDHFAEDGTTSVVAQDPDHPEYGTIRLVLTPNPTELRQWVITDDTRAETTVILRDMTFGEPLSARLFNISAETDAWRR